MEKRLYILGTGTANVSKYVNTSCVLDDGKELFLTDGTGGTDILHSADPSLCVVDHGTNFPGLLIQVSEARGTKCPRCWMHSTQPNPDGLCPRCASVLAAL